MGGVCVLSLSVAFATQKLAGVHTLMLENWINCRCEEFNAPQYNLPGRQELGLIFKSSSYPDADSSLAGMCQC